MVLLAIQHPVSAQFATWDSWCIIGRRTYPSNVGIMDADLYTDILVYCAKEFHTNSWRSRSVFLLKWANPGLYWFFSFFSNKNFTEKTVGVNGIWTRVVGVESEHSDYLTTTTAQLFWSFSIQLRVNKWMSDIKVCQWLDSNHGPLALEATALPTESPPQPNCRRSIFVSSWGHTFQKRRSDWM